MKLLIVDDQLATLRGIAEEIDWAAEGITEVATAQNAMEARLVFKQGVPEVMICDIEMPVESGIDLCRWVRRMEYETKMIFLTCHSEFSYAKEAIELQAIDYILQPAPYEDIVEVVRRAIQGVEENTRQKEERHKARAYVQKQEYIQQNLWRDFLCEIRGREALLEAVPDLAQNQEFWPVLLQFVHWQGNRQEWNDALLTVILTSFITDIFNKEDYYSVLVPMENEIYVVLLQENGQKEITAEKLTEKFRYLSHVFDLYMPCSIACYMAEPALLGSLPVVWQELAKRKEHNVTGKAGLFTTVSPYSARTRDFAGEIRQWKLYLCSGCGERMEQEATELLNQVLLEGELDASNLMHFYQDFMQMLYRTGLEENGITVAAIFRTEEEMELYRNGMKSLA